MFKALKAHVLEEHATNQYHERKIRKGKRRLKLACIALAALVFFLVVMNGIMGAMIWVLLEENKEAKVEGGGAMMASKEGTVVAVREALESLPLMVAPLLSIAELAEVKTMTVTDYDTGRTMEKYQRTYAIQGAEWHNETYVAFDTTVGDISSSRGRRCESSGPTASSTRPARATSTAPPSKPKATTRRISSRKPRRFGRPTPAPPQTPIVLRSTRSTTRPTTWTPRWTTKCLPRKT
jgi:hypothetical protein